MWYGDMAGCIFNHFLLESGACSLAGEVRLRERRELTVLARFVLREGLDLRGVHHAHVPAGRLHGPGGDHR